ncbi:hypothetical protein CWS35_36510 [Bradyrhizobium sp. SK17]|nr:hypothetical protein CWS35_36510 [Bradyrhizobium sp. SK17]
MRSIWEAPQAGRCCYVKTAVSSRSSLMELIGVLLVGLTESFSAYQVSAFRDVVVFVMVVPTLLWRNAVRPPEAHEH